ncbi:hypothetical protein AOXY_G13588 [Acipenser oxyrinchus oxyrinchus]|uniref:Uncharacterized protein n=1 Tax=Acipenser oxyrinchus oxyrinchus TaxID=40147 RepID=A0AAD8D7J1_ACIOX|nr:hypothetical protein AOXY_G13588 [Acipenser oxyrinchus oxyrinchus]
MTDRLLTSFSVLDSYSRKVLSKHSRGHQLGVVQGKRPDVTCEICSQLTNAYDWDFDLPSTRRTELSKPKTAKQIINEEQKMVHKKIRSSVPRATSAFAPVTIPHEQYSGILNIQPFSNPEDRAGRNSHQKGNKRSSEEGYMIIKIKKYQTVPSKLGTSSLRRLNWTKEVERITPLEVLSKVDSQAQVGGVLGFTDISHWYSFTGNSTRTSETPASVFTGEVDSQYSIPDSVGSSVARHVQYDSVVSWNGTCRRTEDNCSAKYSQQEHMHNMREFDSEVKPVGVPLCIEDELDNKSARILSPKPQKLYIPLLSISETHPVVYHKECQYKPFSSQSSRPSEQNESSNKRIEIMAKDKKEIQCSVTGVTLYSKGGHRHGKAMEKKEVKSNVPLLVKSKSIKKVNIRVLSADGTTSKTSDFVEGLPTVQPTSCISHNVVPLTKTPLKPLTATTSMNKSPLDVGQVKNGMNPKNNSEAEVLSTRYLKTIPSPSCKNNFGNRTQKIPYNKYQTADQEPKIDFIMISKPLKQPPLEKVSLTSNVFTHSKGCPLEQALFQDTIEESENDTFVFHQLVSRPSSYNEKKRRRKPVSGWDRQDSQTASPALEPSAEENTETKQMLADSRDTSRPFWSFKTSRSHSAEENTETKQTGSGPSKTSRSHSAEENTETKQTSSGPSKTSRSHSAEENTETKQTGSGPSKTSRSHSAEENTETKQMGSGPSKTSRSPAVRPGTSSEVPDEPSEEEETQASVKTPPPFSQHPVISIPTAMSYKQNDHVEF